jgi:hypothetical protein
MKNAVLWDIKTPVRSSYETYYVSVTELTQLILYEICGFQDGNYVEFSLLGCDAVRLL